MDESRTAPGRPLWERLERIRLSNGWNKVRLAREAGVDRTTIDKWRYQPRSPQPPTVKIVAGNLGIDAEEALRLAGISTPGEAATDSGAEGESPHDRLDRLYAEWRNDPERRERLRTLLESDAARDSPEEDPHDRLERLWREYRDDPGAEGMTLRTLLETWGDRDAG